MSFARTQRLVIATSLALGALWMGCSALGESGAVPDGLPHGGTGEFRFLDSMETGITSPLVGRAIVLRTGAVGAAMATPTHLFYAFRETIDEPPMEPEDHPIGEIYPPAFGASAIHRGPAREGIAYDAGPAILEATEAWQGADLFDPWFVLDAGGQPLLFYAAAGGIGLATATAVDGTFVPMGDGPILGADLFGGEAPRRPSAVIRDERILVYFEVAGAIRLAISDDGASYRLSDELTIEGEDEGASPEIALGAPGLLALETSVGRTVDRLYFESHREDGTRSIYVAGSDDGLTFVRHPRPVIDTGDGRAPAPLALDNRRTLLFLNQPFNQRGLQTRSVAVAVTPGGISLAPETP